MGNWDDESGDETNGLSEIEQMHIDPSGFMADIDLSNNVFETTN